LLLGIHRLGTVLAALYNNRAKVAAKLVEFASSGKQPRADADAKTHVSAKTAGRRSIVRVSAFFIKEKKIFGQPIRYATGKSNPLGTSQFKLGLPSPLCQS
jgi:hypothetical protein